MANDNDDKPINALDKLTNAVERGSSTSKTLKEYAEKAEIAKNIAGSLKDSGSPELISLAEIRATEAQYRLVEEQGTRLQSSQAQIAKTISSQFGEKEFARQVHVNVREGAISTSQHKQKTYAELAAEKVQVQQASYATAAEARAGAEPGMFYEIDETNKNTRLTGGGDPYRKKLLEQAGQAKQAAGLEIEFQTRRQEDRTPNSMIAAGGRTVDREAARLEGKAIQKDVASGKFDRTEEEKKLTDSGTKLAESIKKLSDAFKDFDASSESSVKTLSDAEKEFEKITNQYDKQAKIVKEIDAQGGGGQSGTRTAIGVATSVLDVARNQFVTSNIAQNNMRAAYAGAVNDNFSDQLAAGRGDASALRRLGDNDRVNENFKVYKTISGTIEAGMVVAGGADVVAGALNADSAINPGKAASDAAVKGANVLKGATNLAKGLPQGADAFAGRQSEINLQNEANKIQDLMHQTFNDFAFGMGTSLVGAGSAGGYGAVRGQLKGLAQEGVAPDQAAKLFAQGSAQIGTSFLADPTRTMSAAAKAQGAGIMSAGQYVGDVAHLAGAGGGQKDMENIMANAVARGVDNAKSIAGMVASITSLSSAAASQGISSTAGNAQLFMSRMDNMKGTGMSEEMKQAAAASNVGRLNALTSDTGLNIFTMQTQGRLAAALPNTSWQTRVNTQSQSYGDVLSIVKGLESKMPEEMQKAQANTRNAGTSQLDLKGQKDLLEHKRQELRSRLLSIGGITGEEFDDITLRGKTGSDKANAAMKAGLGMGEAGFRNLNADQSGDVNKKGGATGDDKLALDLPKVTAQQTVAMLSLGGNIAELSTAVKEWNQRFDPKKAAGEAMGAATNMTLDAKSLSDFAAGSSDLKKAAADLVLAITPIVGALSSSKAGDGAKAEEKYNRGANGTHRER